MHKISRSVCKIKRLLQLKKPQQEERIVFLTKRTSSTSFGFSIPIREMSKLTTSQVIKCGETMGLAVI